MPPETAAPPAPLPRPAPPRWGWRQVPVLILLAGAVTGLILLRDHLGFHSLATHHDRLLAFRDAHYLAAVLVFLAAYILIVSFSLPGATLTTLTGGFLFGLLPGAVYSVLGATLGATILFLAARQGFGAALAEKLLAKGGAAARLQRGIERNQWSVLFLMRLVPVFPFFLANLLPALLGARLRVFVVTTFFGIMPGALVFSSIGAGLSDVFAKGETPDLSLLMQPRILASLFGLAALAALPMLLRWLRGSAPTDP